MDFLENLFEDRIKMRRGDGHLGGSGHHDRRSYPSGELQACPQCGAKNNPGSKFCTTCGGKLSYQDQGQIPLACSQWGAPNLSGSSFCMNCGARIQAAAPAGCASCGASIPPAARFCLRCGQEVSGGRKHQTKGIVYEP